MAEEIATAPKAKKPRKEVFSKSHLVDALVPVLEGILGTKISKQKAWDLFKAVLYTAFSLAAVKQLSLSGVGRFYTFDSKRSLEKNKPAARLRFKPSTRVTDILNDPSADFLASLQKADTPDAGADNGAATESGEATSGEGEGEDLV